MDEDELLRKAIETLLWVCAVLAAAAMLCAMLSGCAAEARYSYYSKAEQAAMTEAALEVWEPQFSHPLPKCEEQLRGLTWSTAGEDVFVGPVLSHAGAFTRLVQDGPPTIVFREGVERSLYEERELMAHELSHWLMDCSGRWSGGDPVHADKSVWPPEGTWVTEIVELRNAR